MDVKLELALMKSKIKLSKAVLSHVETNAFHYFNCYVEELDDRGKAAGKCHHFMTNIKVKSHFNLLSR